MNWFKKLLCKLFKINCPPVPPNPPPTTSRGDILFAYFAGGDVPEFANHCNALFVGSWGDWITPVGRQNITDNFVNQVTDAKAAGITRVIIATDWCLMTDAHVPLPQVMAQVYLREFFNALQAAGHNDVTYIMYPVDEPDVLNISTTDMAAMNATLRAVMSEYTWLNGRPLAVTYGDRAGKGGPLPGLASFDWCGFDNYGSPIFTNGEYDYFRAQLGSDQKTVILPGGCDPWKEDPLPFYNKAQQDAKVAMIMPFMWFTNGGNPGIKDNGMAPQYVACGTPIKVANP